MASDKKSLLSGGGLGALMKDTVIYGMSSVVGRFLNYLLVPLYTAKLAVENGGYGVVTEVYSYVALLLVLLTFGMETAFFRFVNKGEDQPKRVYSTALIAVGSVGLFFVASVLLGLQPISAVLGYAQHPEYIAMMVVCVALDAFQCIPFAYLRYQRRPLKFAALKLLFITLNIALNLIYFLVMDGNDVFYIFAINLLCTGSITFLFWKELTGFKWTFDKALFRQMWTYAWPILILGIAGILNQTADKILYPHISETVDGVTPHAQLGIYGACVKIAMIMAMITQAFRYAYEPFVFGKHKDKDNRATYAKAMKYFIIFTLLAFLAVIAYLDILKYIIAPGYWPGLRVVPIVMVAEIMMGIYFNLSFWYKLIDKTIWGAWFSGIGCVVLIAVNVIFVPQYGYIACAWAGVAGYGTAMLLSYFVGQRYYPINYPLKSIAVYVAMTAFFYTVMTLQPESWGMGVKLAINTVCLLLFLAHVLYHEFYSVRFKKTPEVEQETK